jgi:hypothetical protein
MYKGKNDTALSFYESGMAILTKALNFLQVC